ncbi:MAG TPA: type IV toxin-antitoxin system AbiEi family antitoxin domain-containing protein [Solirubrobacteraceae bacterium]|nr:type IV toxin-antitoxin system AbiEi family antitoxin domain-containing protein [Solirubrobacteraceae bacterium]
MRKVPAIPAESASGSSDRAIAHLAASQYGVVSRGQLRERGLTDSAISDRCARGRLHRVHWGVYAVGHPILTRRGQWMGAVLAGGSQAALSHAAAAALWELRPSAVVIDITVPGSGARRRPGLRIHRARDLTGQTTTHDGIPVTTPARTILDLAATLRRRPLERLLDQAENTRLTDVASLEALARAHGGHRGASKLLAALDTHEPGTTLTRSELEERFLELCDDSGLPRPRVNQWIAGLEVDFLFPAQRLVVETDGYRFHRRKDQFERDRHRDAMLTRAGYRTLRFTHHQLTNGRRSVAETVRAALYPPNPGTPSP